MAFFPEVIASYQGIFGDGPGGVGSTDGTSSLKWWVKADAGTSTTTNNTGIQTWTDQSGNSLDATQGTATNQPTYLTNQINGLPVLSFDSTDDLLSTGTLPADFATTDVSMYIVALTDAAENTSPIVANPDNTSSRFNIHIPWGDNLIYFDHGDISSGGRLTTNFGTLGQFQTYHFQTISGTEQRIYQDGSQLATDANASSFDPTGKILDIGFYSSTGTYWGGDIAEVLVYNSALNTAERIIVDNYLSAKYNLTTATDNYAGDTAANGDYDFNVAGIGQETDGNSTTATSVDLIIANNSYLLDDGDYLLLGHNQATNSTVTTDIPTGTDNRWNRVWYLDKTDAAGTTGGTVDFTFDFSTELGATPSGNYGLLYRTGTTGNFAFVTTPTATISGNQVVFTGVDTTNISDGYYTLVSDTTTPTLSSVSIVSDNADTTLAKVGDTVTLTFTASEELQADPTVTIGGQTATVTNTSGNTYTATYTLQSSDTEGTVAFNVAFTDFVGNAGTAVTATTDSTTVTFDKTVPTLSSVSIASNNADTTLAKVGDTVTATFTASETLSGTPTVTIGGQTATVTNTSGNTYTATYTLTSADTEGSQAISIDLTGVTDAAGNAGTAVTATTDSTTVTFDKTVPTVNLTTDAADTVNAAFTVTATFDEDVTGFALADITVGNGTASNFSAVSTTEYTFDVTPTADGSVTVDVAASSATDDAGNNNSVATQLTRTADITAPDAPTISTTGTTNDNTPDINGTAEAGSTVAILVDGAEIGTTTADADGNWTFTPTTELTDGTYNLTATATDTAGNTSTASSESSLTVDATAPDAPTISTTGTTNDNTPDIDGTAEAGSTVTLFQNGIR